MIYLFPPNLKNNIIKVLKKILLILEVNKFQILVDKCQFYKDTINFLGNNVSTVGLKPTTQKVKDIKNFPEPRDTRVDSWEW